MYIVGLVSIVATVHIGVIVGNCLYIVNLKRQITRDTLFIFKTTTIHQLK